MPRSGPPADQAIRETAYYIWEREGRPHGRDHDHWHQARAALPGRREVDEDDEEKVLAGRGDANVPAMLTRDVPGG
jgi:hypothetical protein